MHPSQMGPFRNTIIICMTIAFAGALMVFTAQANLDLLQAIYPDPKFYMFGLLALEGGTAYWTGYYLLHPGGAHKGLALVALVIDMILSGTGFFYELEMHTNSVGTVSLPPVIIIVGFAIFFNAAWALLTHLVPSGAGSTPRPKEPGRSYVTEYPPTRQLEQRSTTRDDSGPGLLKSAAAGVVAAGQDIMDLAREKRQQKKERAQEEAETVSLSHDDESEPEPVKAGLKRPLPKSSVSQPDPQSAPSD